MAEETVETRQPESRSEDGNLRERLARLERSVDDLGQDMVRVRDRSHDFAGEIQKLIGEVGGLSRTVERVIESIQHRTAELNTVNSQLHDHVAGCRAEVESARTERLAFRSEMRRYMVSLFTALLFSFLAGKFHLSFLPGASP